jgi:hypothetical protein
LKPADRVETSQATGLATSSFVISFFTLPTLLHCHGFRLCMSSVFVQCGNNRYAKSSILFAFHECFKPFHRTPLNEICLQQMGARSRRGGQGFQLCLPPRCIRPALHDHFILYNLLADLDHSQWGSYGDEPDGKLVSLVQVFQ